MFIEGRKPRLSALETLVVTRLKRKASMHEVYEETRCETTRQALAVSSFTTYRTYASILNHSYNLSYFGQHRTSAIACVERWSVFQTEMLFVIGW